MKDINDYRGFQDRCYKVNKTKWGHGKKFVWDEKTREIVPASDYYAKKEEIDAPKVSIWNTEFSYLATGQRLSKRQLKEYCKRNNKTWENG